MRTITIREWAGAVAVASILTLNVSAAQAQSPPAGEWQHGGFVTGFGGGADVWSRHSFAAGAAFGWEVTPRLALEAGGRWFDVPARESAFAADISARIGLVRRRAATPYVSAGAGMFRTAVSAVDSAPAFYRARIDPQRLGRHVFRDPLWSAGAGADVQLARHLSMRPDVTVLIVTTRSDARVVPVYGIRLTYYFEPHERASR